VFVSLVVACRAAPFPERRRAAARRRAASRAVLMGGFYRSHSPGVNQNQHRFADFLENEDYPLESSDNRPRF